MTKMLYTLYALFVLAALYTGVHAQEDGERPSSSSGRRPDEGEDIPTGSFSRTYGVFIICESGDRTDRVEARLFTDDEPLRVSASHDCRRERVRGRAFRDSVTDHALLWRDQRNEFDELRDYFEELYLCDEDGQVVVERFEGSNRYRSIYECRRAYEAHVVRFEYEG